MTVKENWELRASWRLSLAEEGEPIYINSSAGFHKMTKVTIVITRLVNGAFFE